MTPRFPVRTKPSGGVRLYSCAVCGRALLATEKTTSNGQTVCGTVPHLPRRFL